MHTGPIDDDAQCTVRRACPRVQRVSSLDVRLLDALAGALAPGALARALAGTGASHPQRRGEGRLGDPVLGNA